MLGYDTWSLCCDSIGTIFLAIIAVLFVLAMLWLWPRYNYLPQKLFPFFAERISEEPIIHSGLSSRLSESTEPNSSYTNINGPSLIQVPDWLPNPLGKYYLYFAHHKGEHSNRLERLASTAAARLITCAVAEGEQRTRDRKLTSW